MPDAGLPPPPLCEVTLLSGCCQERQARNVTVSGTRMRCVRLRLCAHIQSSRKMVITLLLLPRVSTSAAVLYIGRVCDAAAPQQTRSGRAQKAHVAETERVWQLARARLARASAAGRAALQAVAQRAAARKMHGCGAWSGETCA